MPSHGTCQTFTDWILLLPSSLLRWTISQKKPCLLDCNMIDELKPHSHSVLLDVQALSNDGFEVHCVRTNESCTTSLLEALRATAHQDVSCTLTCHRPWARFLAYVHPHASSRSRQAHHIVVQRGKFWWTTQLVRQLSCPTSQPPHPRTCGRTTSQRGSDFAHSVLYIHHGFSHVRGPAQTCLFKKLAHLAKISKTRSPNLCLSLFGRVYLTPVVLAPVDCLFQTHQRTIIEDVAQGFFSGQDSWR